MSGAAEYYLNQLYTIFTDVWDSTGHTLKTTASALASVLGTTADASIDSDAAGTIKGCLRGLAKATFSMSTALTSVLGATSDAAIDADAAGSIKGSLRGLAKAFFARTPAIGVQAAAASRSVTPASDSANFPVASKGADVYQPFANAAVQITISGAGSTQSAALAIGLYRITTNVDVAIAAPAANPTATTADSPLWAYQRDWISITVANDKVAAIRLIAATGTVTLTRMA